jgi:membrane protein DedA with SNARE-associated domain
MDTFMQLIDFVLHVDRYLGTFVAQYGVWVYALLFLIIFVETGLVVMPFLPGDSLLFVVGTLCAGTLDPRYFSGKTLGFLTAPLLTERTTFMKPMVASPLC